MMASQHLKQKMTIYLRNFPLSIFSFLLNHLVLVILRIMKLKQSIGLDHTGFDVLTFIHLIPATIILFALRNV